MSAFRGIATGFLQAKIRNTEANDALKARVLETASNTLLTETIPNAIEAEKIRRSNYDLLVGRFGVPGANVMDASGYTFNESTMKKLDDDLKANELNDEALKNANFETDFDTRYNTRVKSAEEKYNPILQKIGIDNIGGLGFNTVEALVKPTTTTAKDTMADTVIQTPIKFDSMQLSDYLTPTGIGVALDSNKFAKAAQSVRGFDQLIKIDPVTKEAVVTLGNRGIEFTALRDVTQEYLPQFGTGKEGEASLPAALSFADKVLKERTEDIIFGVRTASGRQEGMVSLVADSKTPGVMKAGNTFSNSFLTSFPNALSQKKYIATNIKELPTLAQQQLFAQKFPEGIKFSDGTDAKIFLLQITGLSR
jgi:hypothetical protein